MGNIYCNIHNAHHRAKHNHQGKKLAKIYRAFTDPLYNLGKTVVGLSTAFTWDFQRLPPVFQPSIDSEIPEVFTDLPSINPGKLRLALPPLDLMC